MKKILLVLSVALLLPLTSQAQKFGYVNTQEILEQMPELKAVYDQLDTLTKQYENEFLKMRQEYENKIKEYQAAEKTMPESIKEVRATEIGELQQRIEMFQQTAQSDIQAKQRTLLEPVYAKLKDAINAVGKEGNYTYVLDGSGLLYTGSDADDLQSAVKGKLGIK